MICGNCGATMERVSNGAYNCPECPIFVGNVPDPGPAPTVLVLPNEAHFVEGSRWAAAPEPEPTVLVLPHDALFSASSHDPEPFTGIPVYARVRKLEERVARLESYVADARRRDTEKEPKPSQEPPGEKEPPVDREREKFFDTLRARGLNPSDFQFPESGSSFRDPG